MQLKLSSRDVLLIMPLHPFIAGITVFYLCFPCLSPAQDGAIKFEQLTKTEGLSHTRVQCILQDKQGYIWFGTVRGLNRSDPYGFKAFQNILGDSLTIADNNIVSLYQAKDDIIWIGTSTGLSKFNPRTETFSNYTLPGIKGWVHDIEEDSDGLLWLASNNGLLSFDRSKDRVAYHKTDNSGRENIHGILIDKDIFWLSSETGIRKYNRKTRSVKTYELPYPAISNISESITHAIIKDSKGFIWMSTSKDGAYRLDPASEKLNRYAVNYSDTGSPKSGITTQIFEDTDGKIWICGEGLSLFDPANEKFTYPQVAMNEKEGNSARIFAMLKDRSGIYWLATERGIAKYDPKLHSHVTIKPNYPYTLQSANTILEDKDHLFWAANYTGFGSLNTSDGTYNNFSEALGIKNEPFFSSVLDRDGSIWFGSAGSLFHVSKTENIHGSLRLEKKIPISVKANVTALVFDPGGVLWAATKGGGLVRYDPSTQSVKIYDGLANEENIFSYRVINTLFFISSDSLLIGTEGSGILLMDTKSGKVEKIKFDNDKKYSVLDKATINAIYSDSNKNIWIGTENEGLWQTDISFSKVNSYSAKDRLLSMNINQVTGDDLGNIWLNTNLGIDVIDPLNKRSIHYTAEDGLDINNPGYIIKKASGDLIRVDFNGLHIFHSSSINLNKEAPPVYISSFKVLDKAIPVYGDTTIKLKYYQNYVSFGYIALNYTQFFKNRYQYKLQGLNKAWIEGDNSRTISYANLSSGTYVFQVKASNNNDVWNERGAQITLIISRPFWNTWWFITACVLAICGTIYIIFQYRLRQRLRTLEIRNTISRDLHDEVGSTLSSIGFLSSMALNDLDNSNEKLKNSLFSISESSHEMLDAMNDIIWNIQPQNDILEIL